MDKKLIGDVLKLKQVDKDLVVLVERVRAFLPLDENDEESPMIRPYGLFVIDHSDTNPRFVNVLPVEPSAEDVLQAILQAMLKPMTTIGRGKSWRAKRVFFTSQAHTDALKSDLAALSVEALTLNDPKASNELREVMAQFNAMLGGESNPDLIKIPGMTVPMLSEYFEAAAAYYEAKPWQHVWNEDIVEIQYGDGKPYYGALMGFGGEELGLALYASINELDAALDGFAPTNEADMKRYNLFSLLYGGEVSLGFEDLEALEKYKWPIPNPNAYPGILRIMLKKGITLPTFKEMLLMSAALRMLPTFVREEMKAVGETPIAATKTYALSNVYGQDKITFRYPRQGATIEEGARIQDNMDDGDESDEWDDEWDEEDDEQLPIWPENRLLALTEKIEDHLPFRVEIPNQVAEMLKRSGAPIGKNTAFKAVECKYVDEYVGIILSLEIRKGDSIELPLAFGVVDKNHPLYSDFVQYTQAFVEAQPDYVDPED